jgi:hypothetical protein
MRIPAGPVPGTCGHMAYVPRSDMAFPGDIHHDFRDFQNDDRLEIIARWVGLAAEIYVQAARIVGRPDDPIADCLTADDLLDARTVMPAHDHMARHWRAHWLPRALSGTHLTVEPPFKCVPVYTYRDLQDAFTTWLLRETELWSRRNIPRLRLMCRIVVSNHNLQGQGDALEFLYGLMRDYPHPLWPR